MSASTLPKVGTRLVQSGYTGTVRFIGPVDRTQGIWLGVEWDDPKRGKHDGDKDGQRYFTCLVPNSGSFIRPSPAISYGTTFLTALCSKYVEIPHGFGAEKVILGSSGGAIEVEAVNLDKIRSKLSRVEKLRQVSLDNEQVARGDPPGEINKTSPGIRGLDLSKNLLPSWDVVALIVEELPRLERLVLNWNRLLMPTKVSDFCHAFRNLKELQISATMTSWAAIRRLASYMSQLQVLEAGYNLLAKLSIEHDGAANDLTANASLTVINFDSNQLTDWASTCEALRNFTGLQRVILTGNGITAVDVIARTSDSPLVDLKHLALASNALRTWADIDHIPLWCPVLESLTLAGNPLVEDEENGKNARQLIIAKIPSLLLLDSAGITPKERTDCELFYLSYISKRGPEDDDAKAKEHPRWKELCEKHGRPYIAPPGAGTKQDTLAGRLIEITVHRCTRPPASTADDVVEMKPLRVLPSMSLRNVCMKVMKTFKIPRAQQESIKMWLKMPDGDFAELDSSENSRDLEWWGLENGAHIILVI